MKMGRPSRYLLAKSSRSSIRATVTFDASFTTPSKVSGASHVELKVIVVRSGSRILKTCRW